MKKRKKKDEGTNKKFTMVKRETTELKACSSQPTLLPSEEVARWMWEAVYTVEAASTTSGITSETSSKLEEAMKHDKGIMEKSKHKMEAEKRCKRDWSKWPDKRCVSKSKHKKHNFKTCGVTPKKVKGTRGKSGNEEHVEDDETEDMMFISCRW